MNAEITMNPTKIGKTSVKMLELSMLLVDLAYQARAAMDEETIQEYADLCDEPGFHFDTPIVAYKIEDKYYVVEGFHRVAGAKRAKCNAIRAEIREGTRQEAMRCAIGSNAGLRRTNADKQHAVEMAFIEFGGYSDRRIASLAKVSASKVAKFRATLKNVDPSSKRVGHDGRIRALPTKSMPTVDGAPAGDGAPAVDGAPVVVGTHAAEGTPAAEGESLTDKTDAQKNQVTALDPVEELLALRLLVDEIANSLSEIEAADQSVTDTLEKAVNMAGEISSRIGTVAHRISK